jgi:hypothetical protein
MEIDYAAIAQLVEVEKDGDIRVSGEVGKIDLDVFPGSIPPHFVAVRLRLVPNDQGDHTVRFTFRSEEGGAIVSKNIPLTVPAVNKEGTSPTVARMSFRAGGNVSQPGGYAYDIVVDGRLLRSLPLHVGYSRVAGTRSSWTVAVESNDMVQAGPFTIMPAMSTGLEQVTLIVNSELADFQGTVQAPPGMEIKDLLVMGGGSESLHVKNLKIGDGHKQLVQFRGTMYYFTLLTIEKRAPKAGYATPTYVYELFVEELE